MGETQKYRILLLHQTKIDLNEGCFIYCAVYSWLRPQYYHTEDMIQNY